MDEQSVSINQAFRQRIRSYMKAILIFNSCKLAAAIGALVAAIFIKVYSDKYFHIQDPVFYILPSVGAAVTILISALVVYVFTSTDRQEHFISNVILYRIIVIVCQIPLAAGFGTSLYFVIQYGEINQLSISMSLPAIMYLVFSGLIIFFFAIGNAICMRRIYAIKFLMFLTNTVRAASAGTPINNRPAGFGSFEPTV